MPVYTGVNHVDTQNYPLTPKGHGTHRCDCMWIVLHHSPVSTLVFDKCRKSNNKNVQSITFFRFFSDKKNIPASFRLIIPLHIYDILLLIFHLYYYICENERTNQLMNPLNTSVLLIYTGGTIGMIENTVTGALENFNFEQLQKHVPELQKFNFPIDTYQFDPPMDSSDMEPDMWRKLVSIIHENYDRYQGFVILHGTDTMAYTASALSFMLEGLDKPVILTGSQLPIGVLRTDGKENLMTSIEIAIAQNKEGKALVPEVCIFFENHLMRGNRTTKINAENFNAFRSFNYPVLAEAGIHIKYNNVQIHVNGEERELKPHYLLDTNVVVLKLFPGIQENVVATI